MRNKDKRMTAANAFWALDALTVILLGIRLCGETFYIYSHAGHTGQSDEYWMVAGEILLDYLPILICLTLAATAMTLAAIRARSAKKDAPMAAETGAEPGSGVPATAALEEPAQTTDEAADSAGAAPLP